MVDVLATINDITPEWLTAALQENGQIQSSVTRVDLQPIGAGVGLMAELCRLVLSYEADEELPATMIAKCAAQNDNRAVAQVLDFYHREVNFYNYIGADCLLNVPSSYYGAVNDETYDCVLLIEDLGDVSPRDQLIGASVDEALSAIERIASMHAKWWGKTESWMYDFMSVTEAGRLKDLVYMPALEPAIEKFADHLDDKNRALLRTVGENYAEFWARHVGGEETFIHGDYRQDNMIYSEGSLDAKVMDWQISGSGKGIFDVTYFMCQSLQPGDRKSIERDALQMYVAKLAEHGIDYSIDEAWQDYRRIVLGCLVYPVTVCGTLDLANDRGRALAEAMLTRNLIAIDELDCAELIS